MTTDIFAEMAEDATKAPEVPTDDKLEAIAGIVQEQVSLEDRISTGEKLLSQLKKDLAYVQTKKLPDALTSLGLAGVPMADGSSVEIKPFVSASISKANKEEAHKWLEDNNHGDLIKHVLSINVGRDKEKEKAVVEALATLAIIPDDTESVHGGTLKVWVREQVEEGKPIPLELFGAFLGQKAIITRGK